MVVLRDRAVVVAVHSDKVKLSIIIPVLNESELITHQLTYLSQCVNDDCEVIVVDGGSCDDTFFQIKQFSNVIAVQSSKKGRATQMNTGAAIASADILLFVHSDTILPDNFLTLLSQATNRLSNHSLPKCVWGFFPVKLSGAHWLFRVIEFFMNLRSKLSAVATGDQCVFVCRTTFNEIGEFADIPLMEDVEISKRLRRQGAPLIMKSRVTTSSRRWEKKGILRTVLLMWRLRLYYFLGVSPDKLVKRYYN